MIQIHTYLLVHKTILWPTQNSESLFIVNSENESLRRLKVFGMLGYWTATLWFGPPSTIITNSRPCHNQVLWDHHYAKKKLQNILPYWATGLLLRWYVIRNLENKMHHYVHLIWCKQWTNFTIKLLDYVVSYLEKSSWGKKRKLISLK